MANLTCIPMPKHNLEKLDGCSENANFDAKPSNDIRGYRVCSRWTSGGEPRVFEMFWFDYAAIIRTAFFIENLPQHSFKVNCESARARDICESFSINKKGLDLALFEWTKTV